MYDIFGFGRGSVAEEPASVASAEAVVGGLRVGVVRDDAVVARLLDLVSDDHWPNIGAARHPWHLLGLLVLHPAHSLLSSVHVRLMLLVLVALFRVSADHGEESLSLLSCSGLVVYEVKSVSKHHSCHGIS